MLGLGNLLSKGKVLGFPNKYSFNFDGSNDYLDCGFLDDFVVTNNISVSLWFNASGIQDFDCFFSQRVDANNILKAWYHGNNIVFEIYEGGTKAGRRISWTPDSNWHHLVFSFDTSDTIADSKVQIYLDGALPTQTDIGGYGNSGSTESFRIGSASNDNYFTGKIDEFAFWNAVLSASDVAKIGSKPVDLSKASTYDTDRTSNLKLWLRAGDKVLPESDASIARSDFYTDFDGSNDYVALANTLDIDLSETWSISCWFNTNATSAQFIFASTKGASSRVSLTAVSNIIQWTTWNGSSFTGKSGSALPNVWHHVVATLNNTTLALYINGVAQTGTSTGLPTSTVATLIGAKTDGSNTFSGQISNLSVYQTVLDAQTIKQFAKSRFTPMRDNRFSVVDFDGSNDKITTNVNSTLTDGTYIFWAKATETGANKGVFGHGGDQAGAFSFNWSSNRPLLYLGGSRYRFWNDTSAQDDGVWHCWAVVLDADDMTGCKLYVDGVEQTVNSTSNSGDYVSYSTGLTIGSDSVNYAECSIAQFAVYSDLKDSDFIYAQWSKGITADFSSDANLSAYYRMGDDTSKAYPTIADSSSNSNDGTITNGASDDIVQQMVAGYDMGAFESTGEETLELVSNGNLEESSNSPSISGVAFTYYSGSGARSADYSNGGSYSYKLTGAGASDHNAKIIPNNSLLVGKELSISVDVYTPTSGGSSGNIDLRIINHAGSASTLESTSTKDAWVTLNGTFVYDGTSAQPINIQWLTADSVIYLDNISVKEVIQSADLSDTYPAIIDVNEPVLGSELVTNGSFETVSDGTHGYDNGDGTVDGYVAINSAVLSIVSNKLKVLRGGTDTKPNALYSFTATSGKTYLASVDYDISNCNSVRFSLDEGDSIVISSGTTGTLTHSFVSASTGSRAIFLRADCDSSEFALFDNFSIKEIQGNPSIMTNQDSADLVYSSVLPDQSFLTGVNSAYNFIDLDGSDEYIAHSNISFTGAFSISSWINLDNVSSGRPIVGDTGNNNWFKVVDADTAGIRIAGGTATEWDAGMTFPTGSWAYVAVVRNASNEIIVYVNGVAYTSNQPTLSGTYVLNALGQKGNGQYFDGKIGQIALYNKALSATEVGAIYTLGRHGNLLDKYSDNLKGYWAMSALDASTGLSDVGDGTIYDRSGQSNHGTATNTEAADLASSPNATPNGYSSGDTNRSTTKP